MPYPNTMGLWPQFRSPLVWDVFAITTYGTVSLLFWYVGLIPDLATLRDRAQRRLAQLIYGFLAMGWRGSTRHWRRYETAYFLIAALATPLVVSVHTVVSFDFAIGILPGWHSTIFPPYFVAGALFSGFAGADHRHSSPHRVRAGRLHHPASPGQHGQDHARQRAVRRLESQPI
jgi:molybdopterin-containing oxidoreductase family membrane subunit